MSKLYIEDVLRVAAEEIGYMEKASNKDLDSKTDNAGNGNYTKYARDLWDADPHFYQGPKNGYDWCTVFVDWCIYVATGRDSSYAQAAKFYTGPYGAGCEFAANYYKAAGAWYPTPKPGDQVIFGDFSHTGLVEKVENGRVYTIEGNSNNMVRRKNYTLNDSYITGYGRPRYDGEKQPTKNIPFVDVRSDSWYADAVRWAYNNGITAGTDPTHFSPDKPCTRAEIIQMLYKAFNG